jgi:hypothetical protein
MRLMKYLVYLLAFVLPVTQSIPIFNIAGRSLNLGLDTLILLSLYMIYSIVGDGHSRVLNISINAVNRRILYLLFWYLISLGIVFINPKTSSHAVDATMVFLRWAQYVPLFFILHNINYTEKNVRSLIRAMTYIGLAISLTNIYEYNFIGFDSAYARGATFATRSLFISEASYNYNITGTYLMIVIILNLARYSGQDDGLKRKSLILLIILTLGLLYNTSRSSLLALIFGVVLLLYYGGKLMTRKTITQFILISVFMLLVYLPQAEIFSSLSKVFYVMEALPVIFGGNLESIDVPDFAVSSFMRFSLWFETIGQIMLNPIVGGGFRSLRCLYGDSLNFTADNFYLETVADTGLIGLFLFTLFLSGIYKKIKTKGPGGCAHGPVVSNFLLSYRVIFWCILLINLTGSMFSTQTVWGTFVILSIVAMSLNSNKRGASSKLNNTGNG